MSWSNLLMAWQLVGFAGSSAVSWCGDVPYFHVPGLGMEPQQVECRIGGEPVDDHQRALGLLDRGQGRELALQRRNLGKQVSTGGFNGMIRK